MGGVNSEHLQAHRHDPAVATRLVHLQAGELRLALTPDVGGAIASFQRCWHEGGRERCIDWLRPASAQGLAMHNPLAMASFPLVPFCNRIRNGRALFEGREIRFPPNHPAEDSPHPLHGIGWQRPWTVLSAGPHMAELALDVAAGPAWPWAFQARQRYTLAPQGLDVEIALTNADAAAMPAGIGHHPYLPHLPGTRLTAATLAMWDTDAETLPTRLAEDGEVVRQLRQGVELAQLHTDNNFTGWSRTALLEWPQDEHGPARSLQLRAEPPLDFFVLYCQRGHDAICAEPVSQCTDWLHLRDRYGADVLGGARLEPGETLTARFSLTPRWQ